MKGEDREQHIYLQIYLLKYNFCVYNQLIDKERFYLQTPTFAFGMTWFLQL